MAEWRFVQWGICIDRAIMFFHNLCDGSESERKQDENTTLE